MPSAPRSLVLLLALLLVAASCTTSETGTNRHDAGTHTGGTVGAGGSGGSPGAGGTGGAYTAPDATGAGGSAGAPAGDASTAADTGAARDSAGDRRAAVDGGAGSGGAAGAAGAGGSGSAGSGGAPGSGGAGGASAIPTQCAAGLPAGAQPVDVSHPTTVVGSGTAASCTFAALNAAVTKGGIVTFSCGGGAVTIPITATLMLPTATDTVIDGGNKITLDGRGAVQILRFDHGDFMVNTTRVTLQHLTLVNGKTTPTQAIPTAPAPCSQGWDDGEGGALYMRDGNLTVIDCTFSQNQAALLGPDTGGGAIYILGSHSGLLIARSVFTNNKAANGGAVGGLFAELQIYDSLFQGNTATGNGANSDDATKCSVINNGQHEVGSGGNGAAIYQDGGNATNVLLCGDDVVGNAAGTGAFGGGVFMTSNDWSGTITVRDSTITGNTGGSWTQVKEGTVTALGTAFGVNAKSATLQNSTLQGVH